MQKYNKCCKFDLMQPVCGRDYLTVAEDRSPLVSTLHGVEVGSRCRWRVRLCLMAYYFTVRRIKGHVEFERPCHLVESQSEKKQTNQGQCEAYAVAAIFVL